ncbi:MAG: endonuclease [Bacteroidaceae bacterium]|nr:endonuclease [Bacteroidaceae bacterium]
MKHLTFFVLATTIAIYSFAQPTSTYYSAANGKSDSALKTALFNIIKGHTVISYDGLITAYKITDVDANGKIWDIYSNYHFSTSSKCGNYSEEGDCYNREHTVPQSWFNSASPMKSDIIHVLPTDGFVNGKRSNYPYGNVGTASYTSGNGSKLGACKDNGYSGTVFEPIDEYKGDIARIYFYMATRYEDEISSWSGNVFGSGNGYNNGLKTWTINVLLQWHRNDPVSQKEIDRNNNVFTLQKNRNPFVDFPRLAEYIWGDDMTEAVDFSQLTLYSNDEAVTQGGNFKIYYNGNGGSLSQSSTEASSDGTAIIITTIPTRSGFLFVGWNTSADGSGISYSSGASVSLTGNLTLFAQWQPDGSSTGNDNLFSEWVLVTDNSELIVGDKYVITSNVNGIVAGDISKNVMSIVSTTFSNDYSIIEDLGSDPLILTLGGKEGAWTLSNDDGELLGTTEVKKVTFDSSTTTWNISIASDGTATIFSTNSSFGRILYNANSPRFTTYTSNTYNEMLLPQLYHYATLTSDTPAETFPITVLPSEGGSVSINTYEAAEGVSIFVTAIPSTGYEFDGWKAYALSDSEIDINVNSNNILAASFIMPAEGVTLSASFIPRLSCNIQWITEGNLFASETIYSGETFAMPTTEPTAVAENYVFKGWTTEESVNEDGIGITYVTTPYTVSSDITFYAVFAFATTTEGTGTTILLNEGFSDATKPDNEEYQNENFSLIKVFNANEAIKIGSSSYSGSLSYVIKAEAGSLITVSLDVKPYKVNENTLLVSVSGNDETWTIITNSTTGFETFTHSFVSTEDNSTITLTTISSSKRILVDNLVIAKSKASVTSFSNFTLVTSHNMPGDVNADGKVNVSDVTALVSHILGTGSYDSTRCDVNNDSSINISDITALVTIILGMID